MKRYYLRKYGEILGDEEGYVRFRDVKKLEQENTRLKEHNREMVGVLKHVRKLRLTMYYDYHIDRDIMSLLDEILVKAEEVGEC